ncbi:T9SS type A sorting domain-containing protein [Lacinutrix jangbogonensis]|uniref:T9SS type A sorting domain-containing protein n=1 Tax=Lacinutrix jangbogonensis TaxID=1469557 RepID=UPI0009DF114E
MTLKIFPNPTENTLYINNKKATDYSIHSIGGKRVKTGRLSKNGSLFLSKLKSEIYFISLNTGIKKETIRFIKK